jgi:RNA polymerase sigma factor (sigma-70 family)
MLNLSDETLMLSVKKDNLSEMSVLFERYHVKLYNFFLSLTFNKTLSHDLTQNLFYRMIKYRKSFNEENGSFKSWIYQMARNVHIDSCKQEKRKIDNFKNVENYNDKMPDTEEVFNEEDFSKLDLALSKLRPEQLEVIVLSRFQNLKYEEISKLTDSTVAAIKVKVHRAIKQLKEIYFTQQ